MQTAFFAFIYFYSSMMSQLEYLIDDILDTMIISEFNNTRIQITCYWILLVYKMFERVYIKHVLSQSIVI